MDTMVVCAFRSQADAEAARDCLRERGFADADMGLVPGGSDGRAAAHRVASAFARRLDKEQLARYELAVDDGLSLVTVRAADAAAARRAAAVLDQCGRRARARPVPEAAASLGAALDSDGDRGGEGGPPVFDPRDTLTRPRILTLTGDGDPAG